MEQKKKYGGEICLWNMPQEHGKPWEKNSFLIIIELLNKFAF